MRNSHLLRTTCYLLCATCYVLLLLGVDALACTSAIVSGRLTANGRPLLWKHRDTGEPNNRVKRIEAHDGLMEFVALFDARDLRDTAAWIGMNTAGFAIMNTASYNLNADDVPTSQMDREGVVMRLALERCVSLADFETLLDTLPRPMGVEANFGVMDAAGHAAYYETGNYSYRKFDVDDAPEGYIVRTNYSHSGREGEGHGYIRERNALELLAPHVVARDICPATFTEELSRTFYNSLTREFHLPDTSTERWIVDQDFIPRRISTASVVVEGVLPGEAGNRSVMWTALGYPPCAVVCPVTTGEGGVPERLTGQGPKNHAPECDEVLSRKAQVFSISRGNGSHYIDFDVLYNNDGTGYCQTLRRRAMEVYRNYSR